MEVTIRLLTGKEIKLTQEELVELFGQPMQKQWKYGCPYNVYYPPMFVYPYTPGGMWYYRV